MPISRNLQPVLSADEVNALMDTAFPQLNNGLDLYRTLDVFPGGCTVRLEADDRHLRPGGTVSGPALFTLADIGGYACVLSHAGPDALSVRIDASSDKHAEAMKGVVARHLDRFAFREAPLTFDWAAAN